MIPDRYIELMQREIDGANSKKQSAKLATYLQQHPEARAFFDELTVTATLLQRVERIEPPPQLRRRIVDALPKHRYPRRRRFWLGLLAALPIPDFARRPGYAFAGGFGLGLAAMLLIALLLQPMPLVDERGAAGTLLPQQQAARTTLFAILGDDLRGELVWTPSAEAEVLELALETATPVEVVLEFDHARISGVVARDGVLGDVRVFERSIRVRHQGKHDYQLSLATTTERAPALRCRILREGVVVFEQSIPL